MRSNWIYRSIFNRNPLYFQIIHILFQMVNHDRIKVRMINRSILTAVLRIHNFESSIGNEKWFRRRGFGWRWRLTSIWIFNDGAILIIENLFWSHRIFTESGSEKLWITQVLISALQINFRLFICTNNW